MASQVVSAAKRLRISHLLDIYGELLTTKQRTFLKHYFEEDLSFGEVAREYGVSRQAIFDSVKHGEETLERFEAVLHLIESGVHGADPDLAELAARLDAVRERMASGEACGSKETILAELGEIAVDLRTKSGVMTTNGRKPASKKNGRMVRSR